MDADTIKNYFLLYLVSGVVTIGLLATGFRLARFDWDIAQWRLGMKTLIRFKDNPWKVVVKETGDTAFVALGALFLWPFVLSAVLYEEYVPRVYKPGDEFVCKPEHLRQQTSHEEAEAKSFITDPKGRVPAKPFGHLNAGWLKFLAEGQPQYELWTFHIEGRPPHTTSDLPWVQVIENKEGLAWVYDGKVCAEFFMAWDGD